MNIRKEIFPKAMVGLIFCSFELKLNGRRGVLRLANMFTGPSLPISFEVEFPCIPCAVYDLDKLVGTRITDVELFNGGIQIMVEGGRKNGGWTVVFVSPINVEEKPKIYEISRSEELEK